jgi:hypothetical protein
MGFGSRTVVGRTRHGELQEEKAVGNPYHFDMV